MRWIRVAAVATAAAAALAACGGTSTHPRPVPTTPRPSGEAGKPAATIMSDARAALLAASSVRITGTVAVRASGTGSTTQRFDLRLTRVKGLPDATGTVTTTSITGTKRLTVSLAIIRVGGTLYIRGDRAYYSRIGPKAAAVAGRWISLPAAQDTSVAGLTDLSIVAAGLASPSNRAQVVGTARLGSAPVIVVMPNSAAKLYVAASGAPRPLRLQRTLDVPAGGDGTLDFVDYDAPLTVTAPAGAIPIAKLRG